jgi:2-dehydropantoate 2-reductase
VKVLVYGAGAVGSFFGGLLSRWGVDVQFVARGPHLDAIRTNGILIESTVMDRVTIPPVVAAEKASHLDRADLVLVCVKAHRTPDILHDLESAMRDTTIVVPLQNGVESDEVLAARFGRQRVATAVVYVGATIDQPGVVTHVAPGAIILGARLGFDAQRLPPVRELLARSGQDIRITGDIHHERWLKLLWNAGFNTVSAVTGRRPADMLARPELRALIVGIMREVVAVANAQGIMLREKDITEYVAWTEREPEVQTSMMIDRQRGRSMEVDALIGVIARKGEDLRVPTPLSGAVLALLKSLEDDLPIPEASR